MPDRLPALQPRRIQLDSLRIFAVAGVIAQHFLGPQATIFGKISVQLFLVLSAFLITGVLLQCRELAETYNKNRFHLIRQFYMRRLIRIYPPYLLIVLVAVGFNLPFARELFWWAVTFTTNWWIALHAKWPDPFSHFWTLAVLEQFYLFWPWVILWAPRRWLIPLTYLLIIIAPSYRLWAVLQNVPAATIKCVTWASLDALGMGALLALSTRLDPKATRMSFLFRRRIVLLAVLAAIILEAPVHMLYHKIIYVTLFKLLVPIACATLVFAAYQGIRGWVGKALEWPLFTYLGKISYGIYLYHFFMPVLIKPLAHRLALTDGQSTCLALIATIAASMLSWHYLEEPLSNLKKRFSYSKPL